MGRQQQRKLVVAVGLDSDGQTRITKGKGLCIIGGSEETHARMQETGIKMSERLKRQGRTLEDIHDRRELNDLRHECEA